MEGPSATPSVAEMKIEDGDVGQSKVGLRPSASSTTSPWLCLSGAALVVVVVNLCLNGAILSEVSGGTDKETTTNYVVASDLNQPSQLPGFEGQTFSSIQALAQGMTLNFYLWSPAGTSPRRWVDTVLTPQLQSKYGITVNRIDARYSGCDIAPMAAVCTVNDEVAQGMATDGGSIDLIWINGANFAAMKERKLLYGPFASILPAAANYDFTSPAITLDKGIPTAGLEMPFNLAQSIFIHNEVYVPSPPQTVPELVSWILNNPGKFTYSDPTLDFTGAAFVRTFFHHYASQANVDLLGADFDEAAYNSVAPSVWAALNQIESSLYNQGRYYPKTHEEIRHLVANETLLIDFSFQSTEASTRILLNETTSSARKWPVHMQGYTFTSGTIADTNFLAIPVNANNKPAALTAVNYIASAASMFTRAQPEVWGALQAYDPTAPAIKEWDVAFDYINVHEATPTMEALAANRLADLNKDYVSRINEDWNTFVKLQ